MVTGPVSERITGDFVPAMRVATSQGERRSAADLPTIHGMSSSSKILIKTAVEGKKEDRKVMKRRERKEERGGREGEKVKENKGKEKTESCRL